MARRKYIEQIFPIKCSGRNTKGDEALSAPVAVRVRVNQMIGDEKNIGVSVECPHNTGGHGQRCKASHPNVDKIGDGIRCPYSLDIPYVIDGK